MGENTTHGYFYKPALGASGATEKDLFDAKLDVADAEIKANKDAKHTQGTDQGLDAGGGNAVVVADVKDAVTKKHTQNSDTHLDMVDANINMNTHKLTSLAVPSANGDSVRATTKITEANLESAIDHNLNVTIVTEAHTMTVAEAGTVLVSCAVTPYTIGLPTAVGNVGLKYHFIKTDANYNLITLDANSTETFNYENSTGTPNLTYLRLNTYCAEVTIVSDDTNWQVINEVMGQVPRCRAYLSGDQDDLIDNTWTIIELNAESYDIGSNFNTGTHTFTVPISGAYLIIGIVAWEADSVLADKRYVGQIVKATTTNLGVDYRQSALASSNLTNAVTAIVSLIATDVVNLKALHNTGENTADIDGNYEATSITISLLSKD